MPERIAPTTIYYWPRNFLLRSIDFTQSKPYQRISTTVIVALQGQFHIETQDLGAVSAEAVVLGPAARRMALRISGDCVCLLDVAPATAAHAGLMRLLRRQPSRILEAGACAAARQVLAPLEEPAKRDPARLRDLHARAVAAIAPVPQVYDLDERIAALIQALDAMSLDEVRIGQVAALAGVSESRLRSLVRGELGCNLSQYLRWLAAWKAALHLQPGMTLTDAAHAAGFHDLAHANHTINEMFGLSPSRVLCPQRVRLVRC